jgi:hypothetical protein
LAVVTNKVVAKGRAPALAWIPDRPSPLKELRIGAGTRNR